MDNHANADLDVLVLDLTLNLDDLFTRVNEIASKPIYSDEDE